MKILFLILSIQFTSFAGQTSQISRFDSNFKFTLSLNKNTFVEIEPIFIKLTVENLGSQTDSVDFYNFDAFLNNLSISGKKNPKIKGSIYISEFARIPYRTIKPGEQISTEAKLQEQYGVAYVNQLLFFKEDEYTVDFRGNGKKISSNKINFSVTKPHGLDSIISEKFCSILTMQVSDTTTNILETRFEAFKNLKNDFPPNIYTEEIYNFYDLGYSYIGIKEDIINENMWFINNYPNSFYLMDIILRTAYAAFYFRDNHNKENDPNTLRVLNEIIKNNPGTRAEQISLELKSSKKYQMD